MSFQMMINFTSDEVGLISRISASITEGEEQVNVLYLSQIKSDLILVRFTPIISFPLGKR